MDGVGQLLELAGDLPRTGTDVEQLGLEHRPSVLGCRTRLSGQVQGPVESAADDVAGAEHGLGHLRLPRGALGEAPRLLASRALVGGCPVELVGATVQSPRPLLTGPHGEPRLGLRLAGRR